MNDQLLEKCDLLVKNRKLKKIYFGAYEFEETSDGYLKANQYSRPQMEYFRDALDIWYERCDASTAKTIELTTAASKISFVYKISGSRCNRMSRRT